MTREEANKNIESLHINDIQTRGLHLIINKIYDDFDNKEKSKIKDRLAELEKVILDYYLAKGYQVGVGGWAFNVEIDSDYKEKQLEVWFYDGDELPYSKVFTALETTTKEMFDKAIEHFSIKR